MMFGSRTEPEEAERIIACARDAGVKRVVYTSSVGALGLRSDGQPADEDTPVTLEDMVGHYKRSKYLAERTAESFAEDGYDVVIVNPTHYAVALKYDTALSDAPFVVAKGIDETAMHIQRIARENQVEIIHSPPLTRSIYYTTAIEQAIPSQLYIAVAHILTYVLQIKAFRQGQGDKPMPLPSFAIPKHLQH